jgi:hypothetical protein
MAFKNAKKFPYEDDEDRLRRYEINTLLLEGEHFEAFRIVGEENFTEKYSRLRYIVANYNGLVAKVAGDMLFGEETEFVADVNQDFIDGLVYENKLDTQLYESAISNSANGDALFKIRIEDNEIRIYDTDPAIYFPETNGKNPRKVPEVQELAWVEEWINEETKVEEKYLIREVYTVGKIETKVFKLEKDGVTIGEEVQVEEYNTQYGTAYFPLTETNIDKSLLVHIPNMRYKGNKEFWGTSDFIDINSLVFELNNRLTKTANILDKHSDPILAVPDGVLDEGGNVKKEALQMVELGEDGEVPQYIVWNASLENAFKEIDKMMEILFMVSETSPDVLGVGRGQAESGRALKMRLIRTIAKIKRKQRYYTQGLKEVFEVCQLLSKNNPEVGVTYNDEKLTVSTVEPVYIKFSDGIVNDEIEETETVIKKVEAGIMSKKKAVQQLASMDEAEAEAELEEINKSKADFNSIMDRFAKPMDRFNKSSDKDA